MRKIAFRAWDKKGGAMLVEVGVTREGYCAVSPDKDRFVLMQFTGLHDKNGKEIWEGDIVKDANDSSGKPQVITWGEAEWLAGKLALNATLLVDGKSQYIEVIGNIYSNPELIK